MKRGGLFLLFAALSVLPARQDTRPLDTGIFERTGISLMLLDVDVVDEQGRPMPGLTEEDFVVRLGGKVQKIYSLDDLCPVVERDVAQAADPPVEVPDVEPERIVARAPSPPPERTSFILYFDFSQLRIDGRQQALDEGRRWIRETMRPDDPLMITAYSDRGGLADRVPFTTDKARLLAAIDEAEVDLELFDEFAAGLEGRLTACCGRCGGGDPICCQQCCPTGGSQCHIWSGKEYQHGRRSYEALKLFIQSLDEVPGRKALLVFNQNGTQLPEKLYSISNLSHTEQVEEIAAEANQTRTRLYTAYMGNRLDSQPWAGSYAVNLGANLADYTGGGYNRGSGDLTDLTDRAGRESICVYRIGLRAPSGAGTRIFKARVEVRGRPLDNRYRVQFLDEGDRWMRSARNVLARPERARDVYTVAALVPLGASKGRWKVKVQVALDAGSLERVQEAGERWRGRWEVGALLVRNDGEESWEMLGVSEVLTRTDESGLVPVVHERTFEGLRPGEYELRAFVRDRWANVYGGGRTVVELPKPREGAVVGPMTLRADALHVSTALPTQSRKGIPELSRAGKLRKGPLPFGARAAVLGEPLEFVTLICAGEHKDTLYETHRFISRDGLPVLDLDETRIGRAGECATIRDRLDTSRLEPGDYAYTLLWSPGVKLEPREATIGFELAAAPPSKEE